ncbi:MAG TPA: hypothetical protein VJK54_07480 [Chthoniobacterales bacterium]|nr:hypothetical protein [Chthoniobacterales bacterium]
MLFLPMLVAEISAPIIPSLSSTNGIFPTVTAASSSTLPNDPSDVSDSKLRTITRAGTTNTSIVGTQDSPLPSQESHNSMITPSSSDERDSLPVTKGVKDPLVNSSTTSESLIVPTDPSMIPPSETTSAEDGTLPLTPSPNDPNAVIPSSFEVPEVSPISPVNSTESIEKKKLQLKVRYNQVRTQVEKNDSVVELKLKADKASTDEGKRQALRAYYELLFKKMKKVDPSLTERCDIMKGAYLRHLEQVKVEPTIP